MILKLEDQITHPKFAYCYYHKTHMFWVDHLTWICPFGGEITELFILGGEVLAKLPDFQSWKIVS
jgi:hypothetical protein